MIRTILSAAILFSVIWFAVSNSAAVTLNIFFWNTSVSAALVIFVTFLVGFVFGVVRVAPSWFRKHMLLRRHEQRVAEETQESEKLRQRVAQLEAQLAQYTSDSNTKT